MVTDLSIVSALYQNPAIVTQELRRFGELTADVGQTADEGCVFGRDVQS